MGADRPLALLPGQMRFESKASASARLLVVTEGVLRVNTSDSAKGAILSWVSTLKCAA